MLTPSEFVAAYDQTGQAKVASPLWRLALLGVLAGFFIGCGALVSSIGAFAVQNAGLAKAVAGVLFPFGLVMVVLTGAELFTGNCLLTMPLLRKKITARQCLRNWAVVYLSNCLGGALLAAACVYGGVMGLGDGALASYAVGVASAKAALAFGPAFVKGVLCNVLVCAAVMFALSAKSLPGKAVGAFVPVAVFVIAGFEHCVANAFYLPLGMLLEPSLGFDGLLHNLIPVTLGNLVGGCGFAAAMAAAHGK